MSFRSGCARSAEAPEITRFDISDKGDWRDEGTISFANLLSEGGVSSGWAFDMLQVR